VVEESVRGEGGERSFSSHGFGLVGYRRKLGGNILPIFG